MHAKPGAQIVDFTDPFATFSNFTRVDENGDLPSENLPGAYRITGLFSDIFEKRYIDDFFLVSERGQVVHTKAITLDDMAKGFTTFQNAELGAARSARSTSEINSYVIDVGIDVSHAIIVNLSSGDRRIDELSAFAARTYEDSLLSGKDAQNIETVDLLVQKCIAMGVEYRTHMPAIDTGKYFRALAVVAYLESEKGSFINFISQDGAVMRLSAWANPFSDRHTLILSSPSKADGYPSGYTCKISFNNEGRVLGILEDYSENPRTNRMKEKSFESRQAFVSFIKNIFDQLEND